jgi:hypothetical protein
VPDDLRQNSMIDLTWMTKFATKMLRKAEKDFLPRDNSYEFFGFQFAEKGPNIRFNEGYTGFCVEVSNSASGDKDRLQYQIAHEVIHFLAPVRKPPAKMIEEGLAVWFSLEGPKFSPGYRESAIAQLESSADEGNYLEARNLYLALTSAEPNAIRVLRQKQPNFFEMTPSLIKQTIPRISASVML